MTGTLGFEQNLYKPHSHQSGGGINEYCNIMAIHIISEFRVVRNALTLVNNVDCVC